MRGVARTRIIDTGCGNGALCRELARHGYEVVGCELTADGVRVAQHSAPELVFHQVGVDGDPGPIVVARDHQSGTDE